LTLSAHILTRVVPVDRAAPISFCRPHPVKVQTVEGQIFVSFRRGSLLLFLTDNTMSHHDAHGHGHAPEPHGHGNGAHHGHHHAATFEPATRKPYGGWKPPHVATFHKRSAVVVGATMWFWVFYRLRKDWRSVFLVSSKIMLRQYIIKYQLFTIFPILWERL